MSFAAVFIPHEELVWVSGYVVDNTNRNDVKIKIDDDDVPNDVGGIKSISLERYGLPSLPPQNVDIPTQGVEDMTKLSYLHEPAILDNLKR
jgi:myosin-5